MAQRPKETTAMSNVEKLVYSVDEAAERLSIGVTLARQLISEGSLPSLKIGHRRLVAREDLEAFVTECRKAS
jgi:excisionase family DNA binding protein